MNFRQAGLLFLLLCGFAFNGNAQNHQGIDPKNFDTNVKPGDNFFMYVNGNWLKNNPVPASEATWTNFSVIHDQNLTNLRILLEKAKGNKAGTFYALAMDSIKLNKEGYSPLAGEFNTISQIKSPQDLPATIAHLHSIGVRTLFDFSVGSDPKASNVNIVTINQSGLGLPDRDYYLNPDSSMESIRLKYKKHIQKMFQLMGVNEIESKEIANQVFEFEHRLANASMTRVQLRDIEAQYNKLTTAQFIEQNKAFDWKNYFGQLGVEQKMQELIVGQPLFIKALNSEVLNAPIENWKNYLKWGLICSSAGTLSDNIVNENFQFYGAVLSGSKKIKPRWKRAVTQADASLGDIVGQLYVSKYFSADAKAKINTMVDNLLAAYKERLQTRDWMSEETKKRALEKLNTIVRKLGYPDKWRDCSTLDIRNDTYAANFFRANQFEFKFMCNKLGVPVDKTEWGMTPPTVNAYYNPSYNEIVFPAGIMQPPFFDPNADDATNYGAMGAIIGHELTHGFDDQGCQYDANGDLKNWWTSQDSLNFKLKTNKVIDQFNHFAVLDTFHVNGELTIGENIADLGGLTIAYYAYKNSIKGKTVAKIDGFTGEQRFFISWAQGWRGNLRPAYIKQLIKTNPHAPNLARVQCPLSNMQEFYDSFQVKPGDKMYKPKAERAEIW